MSKSEFGICEECNQLNTGTVEWCKECNAKQFQQDFKNWTSGNDNIDKFIQDTQLSATDYRKVLEWIPYDKFSDIKYIAKGGFGNVYKTNWIDGHIFYRDNKNKNWKRIGQNELVALKSLNNSKNVTLEFIKEITSHHKLHDNNNIIRLYGITQDPKTKNYMVVLQYVEYGSLRNYLDANKSYMSYKDMIYDLWKSACGLDTIHKNELIHQDLHVGNILKLSNGALITDIGLCKPANYNVSENTKHNIYGVLPYVAPEILRGQNYTKAVDIYSFGIIMYEVFSGLPPYYDVSHDESLAIKICKGLRPKFNIKVPQLIVNLIKRCLDANPLNRPTADELQKILHQWHYDFGNKIELQKEIKEAGEINNNLQTSTSNLSPSTSLDLSYEIHSEAIYTSRLLNFNNLPEPKNSDDYYHEQNDDLISKEFLENKKEEQQTQQLITQHTNNQDSKVTQLENQLTKLKQELFQVRQNKEKLNIEVNQFKQTIKNLIQNQKESMETIQTSQVKIRDVQEQLNQAKLRLTKQARTNETQNQLRQKEIQLKNLQRDVDKKEKQNQELTKNLINVYQKRIEKLKREIEEYKNKEKDFIEAKIELKVRKEYEKRFEELEEQAKEKAKGSANGQSFLEVKNIMRELIEEKQDHIKDLEGEMEESQKMMNKSSETIQATTINTSSNTASSSSQEQEEKSPGEKINEGIKLIGHGVCECLKKKAINKVPFLSSLISKK